MLICWLQVQKLFPWISSLQMFRVNYNDEKTVNSVDGRRSNRIRRFYRSMKRSSLVAVFCRSCWLSLSTTAPWSDVSTASARHETTTATIFREIPPPLAIGTAITAPTASTHSATRIKAPVASRSRSTFFHIDLLSTDRVRIGCNGGVVAFGCFELNKRAILCRSSVSSKAKWQETAAYLLSTNIKVGQSTVLVQGILEYRRIDLVRHIFHVTMDSLSVGVS